ncbi:flagellar filament capping protein FliD [Paraburkholderia sp. GAS82]|jgi:flagellar hook-associated protein 2|uniref:flagellar filament capping protein FliD n=1 Tax=Paraburkholderia sp. GAS82 TaxID=3035137 RepID=UPI003D1E8E95
MSTISSATSSASAAASAALAEAGQSLISGSTGNSSLDVNSLVSTLVNAKVAGQTAALETESANDTAQLSAIGSLSAVLSELQIGLAPLFNGSLQSSFTATASGTGITATAGTGAAAGTYTMVVSQVAASQSMSSGAFSTDQAAAMGTGTLAVSIGGKSMNVNITSSDDSLSGIAAAINSQASTSGVAVSASVVTGSNGSHLVLSSTATGASNVINVSVSNVSGDNGISSLGVTSTAGNDSGTSSSVTSAGSIAWTQNTSAADAEFTINGTAATSASNSITSALSGVTINLTAAAAESANSTQTITVATDTSTQISDIENFVTEYNNVVSAMSSLSSFSSAGSSANGALVGDSMLTTIQTTLGNIVSGTTGGSTLGALGISLQSDGQLTIDTTTLTNAVTNDPAQVASVFNGTNGIAEQLNTSINAFTGTNGVIADRSTELSDDMTSVQTQQTALAAYTAQLTSQYNNEFTALNNLMATTNSDSEYLTQLFGGANSAGAMATASSE